MELSLKIESIFADIKCRGWFDKDLTNYIENLENVSKMDKVIEIIDTPVMVEGGI